MLSENFSFVRCSNINVLKMIPTHVQYVDYAVDTIETDPIATGTLADGCHGQPADP